MIKCKRKQFPTTNKKRLKYNHCVKGLRPELHLEQQHKRLFPFSTDKKPGRVHSRVGPSTEDLPHQVTGIPKQSRRHQQMTHLWQGWQGRSEPGQWVRRTLTLQQTSKPRGLQWKKQSYFGIWRLLLFVFRDSVLQSTSEIQCKFRVSHYSLSVLLN